MSSSTNDDLAGLETMEKGAIEVLDLSVGLGMSDRGEILLDTKAFAPSLEGVIHELLAIIRNDFSRQFDAADRVFLDELLDR